MAKHGAVSRRSTAADARDGAKAAGPLRSVDGDAPATGESPQGALALDRLIHERLRLGIVSALAVNESLSFNDLKQLMQTTDGNLSVHARKLEDAAYVTY